MADIKSGTKIIQNVPGTCSCTRKKGSHQKSPSFKKDKGANLKGLRRDKPSIESNNDSK